MTSSNTTALVAAAALSAAVLLVARSRRRSKHVSFAKPKFNILIVTDMQRDYDIDANMELYGDVITHGYANPIAQFVAPINRIRKSTHWDLCVFTFDWLSADMLTGRMPFCLENSFGATLLNDLVVDSSRDLLFRKNSDDSFCDFGGQPERRTGCTRLVDALTALGYTPDRSTLVFVGQRFERCVLKSVMHARALGYDCSVVMDATYAKTEEPDPQWNFGPIPACAEDVYARAKKAAGARLARGYLEGAGVRLLQTWPPGACQ